LNKTTFANAPYKPGPVPSNPADIPRYLDDEFNRISAALAGMGAFRLPPSYAPPAKPISPQIIYTDATSWDPGSGEGYYYFNSHGVWTPFG